MTTAREVLALVITGDSRGAIGEIEKVGRASERELGNTQSRLDQMSNRLTTFGAAAVGTGALAAAGLYGTAMAAGQLDANLGRIEGNFGAASAGAIQFVENANGIGLSDQQAAQYVANIGELAVGLGIGEQAAAGMTTETVRLVAQLALLKGQTPADALEAVSAGLIGEYDSLQRLVPAISAAAIEERALADTRKASADELTAAEKATATFAIITKSAQDTLARSGDITETNAYKAAMLAASYEDLKTQLGDGALPVVEQTTETLTGAADAFNLVDDATNGWLSRAVSIATVGALAGGGLSFVAGQGIRAHQMFTDLDGPMRTAEGGLTRTGRAAMGLSYALGALLAGELITQGINSVLDIDSRLRDDINATVAATGDGAAALEAFRRSVDTQMTGFSLLDGPRWLASELGILGQAMTDIGSTEFSSQSLADVQAAFDELRNTAPNTARVVLDELERFNAGLDRNSSEYRTNKEFIDRNRESMGLAQAAQSQLTGETERNTGAVRDNAAALEDRLDPLLGLLDAQQRLADAEDRLAEVADTNSRDVQRASQAAADARERVVDATRNLADAQAQLNDVLNDDPMFGLKSVSPEEEIADARARLAEANRLLAENPGNAVALTMRDDAVMDLEDANKRQQDQRRNAEQRAQDIANAQRAVGDAQKGLDDARRGVADAQAQLAEVQSQHGIDSEEYAEAARAVIEANLGVRTADEELAEYLRNNGTAAVNELNDELDRWIALGGPVGAAAASMKEQIAPLVADVAALDRSAANARLSLLQLLLLPGQPGVSAFPIFGTTGTERPVDQFGIPLYGRRDPGFSTGGLVTGPGTATSDSIRARLSAGEFVMRARAVDEIGVDALTAMNQDPQSYRWLGDQIITLPATDMPQDFDRRPGGPLGQFYYRGQWYDDSIEQLRSFAAGGPVGPRTPRLSAATIAARRPEIVRDTGTTSTTNVREGDLVIEVGDIVMQARDDQLAGAAVVSTLRNVASRSGRGLKATSKLVG